jgi:hypothetical protein
LLTELLDVLGVDRERLVKREYVDGQGCSQGCSRRGPHDEGTSQPVEEVLAGIFYQLGSTVGRPLWGWDRLRQLRPSLYTPALTTEREQALE